MILLVKVVRLDLIRSTDLFLFTEIIDIMSKIKYHLPLFTRLKFRLLVLMYLLFIDLLYVVISV